jgi:hypothetical protein
MVSKKCWCFVSQSLVFVGLFIPVFPNPNQILFKSASLLFSDCMVHFRTNNLSILKIFSPSQLSIFDMHKKENTFLSAVQRSRWLLLTAQKGYWQSCRVNVFSLKRQSLRDSGTNKSYSIFEDKPFIYENPNFVIFFIEQYPSDRSLVYTFFTKLHSLSVTSRFLFFEPPDMLSLVNVLVSRGSTSSVQLHPLNLIQPSGSIINSLNLNVSSIQTAWRNIDSNFLRHAINTPDPMRLYFTFDLIPPNCNYLGVKFAGNEDFCFVDVLKSKLNFTTIHGFDESPRIGSMSQEQLDTVVPGGRKPLEIFEHLLTSRKSLPFGFVIVISKAEAEIANPLLAFDNQTWMWLTTAVVIVASLIVFLQENQNEWSMHLCFSTLKTIISVGISVFSTLFEQSPSHYFRVKDIPHKTLIRLILLLWLFVCMVLSGGYRGVFFSFLTSSSIPSVPRNFEDLSMSEYRPLAIDSIPISIADKYFLPYYSYLIGDFLKKTSSVNTTSAVSSRRILYQKLLEKTVHLNFMTYSKIKVVYDNRIPLPPIRYHNLKHDFIIPTNFAAISSTEGLEHFRKLMQLCGEYYLIFSKELDNFIPTHDELVVTRNFIYEPIQRNYFSIKESGLYGIWNKYSSALKLAADARILNCMSSFNHTKPIDSDLSHPFWDYSFCVSAIVDFKGDHSKYRYRPSSTSNVKVAEPISVEVIGIVLIIWVAGSLLGTFLFCTEHHFKSLSLGENTSESVINIKNSTLAPNNNSLERINVVRINYAMSTTTTTNSNLYSSNHIYW